MADLAKSKARKGDSLPIVIIKKNRTVSDPSFEQNAKNDERVLFGLTKEKGQSEGEHVSGPNEWCHWQTQEKSSRYHVSNLKKNPTETFREYASRWTSEATKVQPPYTENEAIACFISSLDGELYHQILRQIMDTSETTFANIVKMGETMEIKMMLESVTPKNANAMAQFANDKKKGKGVQVPSCPNPPYNLSCQNKSTFNHHSQWKAPFAPMLDFNPPFPTLKYHQCNSLVYQPYPQPYVHQALSNNHALPNRQPFLKHQPSSSHQPIASVRQSRLAMEKPCTKVFKTFTPIAEPYNQFYERLREAGMIHPIADATPSPLPKWFDETKHCAYHSGAPGHDIGNCYALKNKIETMIRSREIQLMTAPPSSQYSLFSLASGSNSNFEKRARRKFTFPIESQEHLFERLKGAKVLKPLVGDGTSDPPPRLIHGVKYCAYHGEYCQHDTKSCITLRHKIQDLIDDGVLQLAYDDETQNEDDDL